MAGLNKLTEPAWQYPYDWISALNAIDGRCKEPPFV